MFTDTHCHLLKEYYDNMDEIIKRAKENNVKKIIVSGYNLETNKEVIQLVDKYDIVYGSLGFHPTELDNYEKENLQWLIDNINHHKIIAVGEIGLDYHYEGTEKEKQQTVFRKQIEIAKNNKKPVIIHSRDAVQDTYDIIEETNIKGVMHCFSGSLEMAERFTKLGIYLGVGGIITFKNSHNIKEVIKNIDLEYILLETDAPYLTPKPYRMNKNEPAYIPIIAQKICEIKQESIEKIAKITNNNVETLFDI